MKCLFQITSYSKLPHLNHIDSHVKLKRVFVELYYYHFILSYYNIIQLCPIASYPTTAYHIKENKCLRRRTFVI